MYLFQVNNDSSVSSQSEIKIQLMKNLIHQVTVTNHLRVKKVEQPNKNGGNSSIKRKKDANSVADVSEPKKKRGRQGKPKLNKDNFKKQVEKNLMMEILQPNMEENSNKKREKF